MRAGGCRPPAPTAAARITAAAALPAAAAAVALRPAPPPAVVADSLTLARRFCVAPMMGYSHQHARRLWRLLCPPALLYTEMLTPPAVLAAARRGALQLPPGQAPVALQLGGSCPRALATAAAAAADAGYAEVNLNCGCPSKRAQQGNMGACLMARPAVVAAAVAAMARASQLPTTVKCRLAIDDGDCEEGLDAFVAAVAAAGACGVVLHARRALLAGLSPAQNRSAPPLDLPRARRLKARFARLSVVVNGGLASVAEARAQLPFVDGAMLGRAVCKRPALLAAAAAQIYGVAAPARAQAAAQFGEYIARLPARERHRAAAALVGLYNGCAHNKIFRRAVANLALAPAAGGASALQALQAACAALDAAPPAVKPSGNTLECQAAPAWLDG